MTTYDVPLPIAGLVEPEFTPELTIQQRWEMWRDANPWVVPFIADLLDDWSAHGGRKVGVKAAVEWARWHYTRATVGSEWRWNNTYSSRLARDLIAAYPHLEPVIETRTLKAA